MTVSKYLSVSAASILLGLASLTASAATQVINVDGIGSCDEPGEACNIVLAINIGAGAAVTGVGWDVSITPDGDSWYSEATALLTDSAGGQGITFAPGAGADFPDSGVPLPFSSGGIVNFADVGIPNIILGGDGILLIEFFESFDDVPGVNDAVWGGEISIQTVPVPAAFLLLLSGLLSAGVMRRKA